MRGTIIHSLSSLFDAASQVAEAPLVAKTFLRSFVASQGEATLSAETRVTPKFAAVGVVDNKKG